MVEVQLCLISWCNLLFSFLRNLSAIAPKFGKYQLFILIVMEIDTKKETQTFSQRLRDVGWIIFVCLFLVVCFGLPFMFGDDLAGFLELLRRGEIRELMHLTGNRIVSWILGLILTAAAFGAMWVLMKLGQRADRWREATKSKLVRILCWTVIIIVACCWVLFLMTFMPTMM